MTRHAVAVDVGACAGHGRCYVLAPDVFGDDEQGHSVVIAAMVEGDAVASAMQAASNCPERAISVTPVPDGG